MKMQLPLDIFDADKLNGDDLPPTRLFANIRIQPNNTGFVNLLKCLGGDTINVDAVVVNDPNQPFVVMPRTPLEQIVFGLLAEQREDKAISLEALLTLLGIEYTPIKLTRQEAVDYICQEVDLTANKILTFNVQPALCEYASCRGMVLLNPSETKPCCPRCKSDSLVMFKTWWYKRN